MRLRYLFLVLPALGWVVACSDSSTHNINSNRNLYAPLVSDFGYWPQFRGPRADGISRESNLARRWPETGPKVLWKKRLGGGYGSFSVVEGRVFTMSRTDDEEWIHSWDAHTGETLWEHHYTVDYDAFPNFDPLWHSGPRVTPTIEGNRVFTLGSTGEFRCLNSHSGSLLWSRNLFEISGQKKMHKFGFSNAPLVDGNLVFVEPGGTSNGSLAALDKRTGETVWIRHGFRYGYASPLLIQVEGTRQLVYFTGEGPVAVVPESGDLLWTFPWETDLDINVATPLYHDGKLLISSAYGRGAALLKLSPRSAPEVIWKKKSMANYFSSSIFFANRLYGFSNSRLRCVDFETGDIIWDQPGLGRGSVLVADKMLVVLGENGQLVLAETDTPDFEELASWKAFDGPVWNVPVVAAGRLYIRNEHDVLALDARYPNLPE